MITVEQAKKRITNLPVEAVCELVVRRLMGEDMAPVGNGYFDEPSEDLVIQLLRCEDLPGPTGDAVIEGCLHVYGQLFAWLHTTKSLLAPPSMTSTLERACSVADATGHPKLEGSAQALLSFASKTPQFPDGSLWAVVRGALSYVKPSDETQVSLWETVLRTPSVSAYGFMALLTIDPYSNRIDRALVELFLHQVCDAWAVDTAFLMRRAARERQSNRVIESVLSDLQEQTSPPGTASNAWDEITRELKRRDWSREWLPSSPASLLADCHYFPGSEFKTSLTKASVWFRPVTEQCYVTTWFPGAEFTIPNDLFERTGRQLPLFPMNLYGINFGAATPEVLDSGIVEDSQLHLAKAGDRIQMQIKESLRPGSEHQVEIKLTYPLEDFRTRKIVNQEVSRLAEMIGSTLDYSQGAVHASVNNVA
jgi:hypothetical protein